MIHRTLNIQISRLGQTATYSELTQSGTHKLKVEIASDSYPSQCRAWVYRYDGVKWEFLAEIPIPLMVTRPGLSYVTTEPSVTNFMADRDELLRLAGLILEPGHE